MISVSPNFSYAACEKLGETDIILVKKNIQLHDLANHAIFLTTLLYHSLYHSLYHFIIRYTLASLASQIHLCDHDITMSPPPCAAAPVSTPRDPAPPGRITFRALVRSPRADKQLAGRRLFGPIPDGLPSKQRRPLAEQYAPRAPRKQNR